MGAYARARVAFKAYRFGAFASFRLVQFRAASRCLTVIASVLFRAFSPLGGPLVASHVGQDDRSRLRINVARFRAALVQLRPALRRALRRGV